MSELLGKSGICGTRILGGAEREKGGEGAIPIMGEALACSEWEKI